MKPDINPLVKISRKGEIDFHYATGIVKSSNSGYITTGYNDNIQAFMDFKRHKHHCSALHAEQTAATKLCNKMTFFPSPSCYLYTSFLLSYRGTRHMEEF